MPMPRTSVADFSFAAHRELYSRQREWLIGVNILRQEAESSRCYFACSYSTQVYYTEKHSRHHVTAIGVRNVCCASGAGRQAIIPAIDRAHANKAVWFCPSLARSCNGAFFCSVTTKLARDGHQTSREAPSCKGFRTCPLPLARFAGEQLAKKLPFVGPDYLPFEAVPCGCPLWIFVPHRQRLPFLLHTAVCNQGWVCAQAQIGSIA